MISLVLLPGMDGTGELFLPFLNVLPASLNAVTVAYPSHDRQNYEELAAHVSSTLPAQGEYVLLAESFSGPVAIALAARGDARLRGLVLVCSFARTPLPILAPLRRFAALLPSPRFLLAPLTYALMGSHATPALRRALAAALAKVKPSVMRQRAAATLAVDSSASLAAIRCPILYLQASDDRVVRSSSASHIQRLCPRTEVVRIAGPHFLLQTEPAAAAVAIESFIDRLQNGPR